MNVPQSAGDNAFVLLIVWAFVKGNETFFCVIIISLWCVFRLCAVERVYNASLCHAVTYAPVPGGLLDVSVCVTETPLLNVLVVSVLFVLPRYLIMLSFTAMSADLYRVGQKTELFF